MRMKLAAPIVIVLILASLTVAGGFGPALAAATNSEKCDNGTTTVSTGTNSGTCRETDP